MHLKKTMFTAVVVSAVALGAAPALAAESESGGKANARAGAAVSRDMQAALQRDLGLSAEQAKKHGAQQAKAIKLDEALQAKLGGAYAGSTYDAATGKLLVMVSDAQALEQVKAAGADARLVKHSKAQLEAVKEALDVAAGKAKGSGPADRQASGPRQASVAGLTSWYVDAKANAVHVTVKPGHAKAAKAALAKYGDAIVIEESDLLPTPTTGGTSDLAPTPTASEKADLAPSPTATFMDAGDIINGSCSAGFNLRNPSTGQGYMLTAGHCVTKGSIVRGQGNVLFGNVLESFFPGFDDAIVINQSGGQFIQGPWVDTKPSNGPVVTVSGYNDPPVGTTVCKSGITTGWTCGVVTVKNETVNYNGGTAIVHGLTRHSACQEPGDAGGPVVAVIGTSYVAAGTSSGAALMSDGSRLRCLSVFGQQNISWYFPVATSLAYYGPKYGVVIW